MTRFGKLSVFPTENDVISFLHLLPESEFKNLRFFAQRYV